VARLRPILRALSAAAKRERKTFQSVATNNFFVTSILMADAAGFLYLLGALAVLFPLSADPLRMIPAERLALWPLSAKERRMLRFLTPWLNPVTWGLAALAIWGVKHTQSLGVFAVAVVLFAVGFFVPAVSGEPVFLRWIPAPGGAFVQLVRKSMREMMLTLDFYLALMLGASALAYRIFMPSFPEEGLMVMTLLIVLSLSSYAQCLFGLESKGGLTRYRLMPVEGWKILAAKDVAFLAVILIVTAGAAPIAGLAAGLAALAVGHAASLQEGREQTRWRFSSGASLNNGVAQVLALAGACVTAYRITSWIIIPCALACAGSAWWYGRGVVSTHAVHAWSWRRRG
jgi:hypothetical protein